MKSALKRFLRRRGIAAVTASHAGTRYLDHLPRTAFESTLLRIFPSLEGLHFVQIGANDGQRVDPLNPFIGAHGWQGVLVEPVPGNFALLRQTYAGNPRLTLLQAAVDVQVGQRSIFHLQEPLPPDAPDWVWGLASFDRKHLMRVVRERNWPETVVATTVVPTITWDQVWQRLPAGRCDLLVIDTEGHDLVLLRSVGLRERRPRVVHFEHDHATRADRLALYGELLDLGYELATDAGDTTAWLPS